MQMEYRRVNARREFLSGAGLVALSPFAVVSGTLSGEKLLHNRAAERLPFDPKAPLDVRLRPVAGHLDYWRQTVLMQTFDRFGEPQFIRHIDGYANKKEFVNADTKELWHRVTWKWSSEKDELADGRVLRAEVFPFSKGFTHESPVNQLGGTRPVSREERERLPKTPLAFSFVQQPADLHYMFSLVSDKWTGIERLNSLGDTVTAIEHPTAFREDELFPPETPPEPSSTPGYWRGPYFLTLTLSGLTRIDREWSALLEFDCHVQERLTIPMGKRVEYRRLHAYTMGTIAISLENNHMVRSAWNHIIVDGTLNPLPEPALTDAAPGIRFWRRQVLLQRVSEKEFNAATPSFPT